MSTNYIVGENAKIDAGVIIGYPLRDGSTPETVIGKNCRIRAGTVIYAGCRIGDDFNSGHNVVMRENCRVGDHTSIGTGVCIENNTIIGDYVSVETQSHITGQAIIEDYVFIGAMVCTTNDLKMKYRRPGHGEGLEGPHLKRNCRIGSNATLMSGVVVGEDSIVNAGEVVRKDVPDGMLYFSVRGQVVMKKIPREGIE